MIRLIGQYDSPFVRRVAITMYHHGLPFEREVLSVFTDFEQVMEWNPLGKVPVLVPESTEPLFDSRIIVDYLDHLMPSPTRLVPVEATARSEVLRVEAVALGLAEKAYERGIEFARRQPDRVDENWAERLKVQINSALAWLEARQPDPWLCPGGFSLADITCSVAVTFIRNKQQVPLSRHEFPRLLAHCEHCESLPAFQAAPYSAAEAERSGWTAPVNHSRTSSGH